MSSRRGEEDGANSGLSFKYTVNFIGYQKLKNIVGYTQGNTIDNVVILRTHPGSQPNPHACIPTQFNSNDQTNGNDQVRVSTRKHQWCRPIVGQSTHC